MCDIHIENISGKEDVDIIRLKLSTFLLGSMINANYSGNPIRQEEHVDCAINYANLLIKKLWYKKGPVDDALGIQGSK